MKPVAAIYSSFMQRAYDSVLHDICIQKLHVTLCLDRAGLVGDDGYTHHGVFDYAYLRSMPNMTIMAPKDENELRHMLKTALDFDVRFLYVILVAVVSVWILPNPCILCLSVKQKFCVKAMMFVCGPSAVWLNRL